MNEPTHKQHLILVDAQKNFGVKKSDNADDIELYWQLVREGYLKNFLLIHSFYDWKFEITEKAEKYLSQF